MVEPALRVRPRRRRVLDRQLDDAEQEEPRPGRAGPRPRRPGHRCARRDRSTMLKGLPLAYQRDLQEDKAPLFDAVGDARGVARRDGRPLDDAHGRRASGCARPPARATRPRRPWPTRWSGAAAVPGRPPRRRLAGRPGRGGRASASTRSPTRWSGSPSGRRRHRRPGNSLPDPGIGDALRAAARARCRPRRLRCHRRDGSDPGRGGASPRLGSAPRPRAGLIDARPSTRSGERPKALLHDHLDGGLRPATIVDLAARVRLRRPADDGRRRSWRPGSAAAPTASRSSCTSRRSPTRSASCRSATRSSGSPPSAPRTSPPTASSYAEVRYAPELSTERGLTLDEVVEANLEGFRIGIGAGRRGRPPDRHEGARHRDAPGRPLAWRSPSCAVRWRDAGVVGFDVAGPEAGYRADEATSTRSTTSATRTSTSRSTPARASGCRRSGRRSSSAAPSGSGTASGSSTTSRSSHDGSVALGRLAAFVRDRRDPARDVPDLERPHGRRRRRSPSTRSTSSAGCASGSR